MGSISRVSLLLLVVCVTSPSVLGGKILVFPMDGSHWINMDLLIQGLHARGHEVTVVRTATSWYIKENAPHYRSITVTLPEAMNMEEQDFFANLLTNILTIQREGGSFISTAKWYWEMLGALLEIHQQAGQLVTEIFENKTLMQNMHDAQF
ncbi:UDP-glucuronosyltransferase 2A3, partial [Nibea albiflora]